MIEKTKTKRFAKSEQSSQQNTLNSKATNRETKLNTKTLKHAQDKNQQIDQNLKCIRDTLKQKSDNNKKTRTKAGWRKSSRRYTRFDSNSASAL